MRYSCIAGCLTLAALLTVTPIFLGVAQAQPLPMPAEGFRPPPAPPVKPYKPVAVMPPRPFDDPSFVAFRKDLGDIAKRKDRAALAKLVVAQGFFWIQEKDIADKRKSGIDNLAQAIDLDAKDGSGWDVVAGYSEDPTGSEWPGHEGIICSPADPTIDPKALQELGESTQTDTSEWGYPAKDGAEVHEGVRPDTPVVDKLGMYLVRVLPDSVPASSADVPAFLHVAMPSGKKGFIAADAIVPLGNDQMCYAKDAGGWKITGYFGGAAP
jgi:hypothetical protein